MLLPQDIPPVDPAKVQEPTVVSQKQQFQVDQALRVEYTTVDVDAVSKVITFSGEVIARYDQTEIRCRELRVDMESKQGIASGGVKVTDPEGTIETSALEFNWLEKTGSAKDAYLVIGNVRIWADSLTVRPNRWELTNARGTLSRAKNPRVELTARTLTIEPGKRGVARHVYLKAFGTRLGPIPTYSFTLDRRLAPFKIPEIDYDKDKGLGVSWGSSFLIKNNVVGSAFAASFPNLLPSYGFGVGYSPLDFDQVNRPIEIPNDLGEYLSDGWFNSIAVKDPEFRSKTLQERRLTYGVASVWNLTTTARPEDSESVSKAVDLVGQFGGSFGDLGYLSVVRAQTIREDTVSDFITRLTWRQTVGLPTLNLTDRLRIQTRADSFFTASENGFYGWMRGEVGVIFDIAKGFTVGSAVGFGTPIGTPDFSFDPLPYWNTWHIRADYRVGPYTVRYMTKFDFKTRTWYDREYEFALVAQGFEPFVQYRQFPSDYRIGIRFRLDNFAERLTQRSFNRRPGEGQKE